MPIQSTATDRQPKPLKMAKTLVNTRVFGSPNGIRTRVTAVRGQRPRPLDDRAILLPIKDLNLEYLSQSQACYQLHQSGLSFSSRIPPRKGLRLAVAIRAQHAKIFEPVVVPDSVDVVDLDGERFPPPVRNSALDATVYKEALLQEAQFHVRAVAALDKNPGDWFCPGSCSKHASMNGVGPRSSAKPELYPAGPVRIAVIVKSLDLGPVVTRISRSTGSHNRRFRCGYPHAIAGNRFIPTLI